jgi:4-hydroxyphenylacetate 3-monooxygenase
MGIRTGAAYLEALRDDRAIWIDGERVGDVTRDRRFAAAARAVAALYDMQHEPGLRARMTYASPSSGEPVGLSFIQPASADDLVRRREMVKVWNDATCGMLGRSPDYMNVMLTGFASAHRAFGEREARFADNVLNYYAHVRENDLAMTHTLVNPQVDRSRPVERQSKDLAAKIVRETDAGIVVTGARMVSTLAAFSDDIMVMPSTYISESPDAAPYAFGFSIPVATPGLRFVCRPSIVPAEVASPMDYPLSLRFDEQDALAVFEDVKVPWERVFIHRDAGMCNGLYNRTGAYAHVMHQFSVKNLAKSEFMRDLAVKSDVWPDIERYFQSANADARSRIRLFRLAFDAAVSSFSGRQQLYERYYSGDPVRLAATLYAMHNQDEAAAHIAHVLDQFEAGAPVVSPSSAARKD